MGAAPLSWLAKIGGDTLKTKAKLLSSAINELYDNGLKKVDTVGLDYIKAATVDDLKNKVPEANAVKELNSNLTQQNYELKELVYASGVAKFNEQDGAVQFVYKNGISRICGLIEVTTESPSQLFTAPIAPKKQHWFNITSTVNGKAYTCRLSEESGIALYWGNEYIPVGIYVIDTTF